MEEKRNEEFMNELSEGKKSVSAGGKSWLTLGNTKVPVD